MDILVSSADESPRTARLRDFLNAQGHSVQSLALGSRLSIVTDSLLGVIVIDDDATARLDWLTELRGELHFLSASLHIVTAQPAEKFQACGADRITTPDTPDAEILTGLLEHYAGKPVPAEMRTQLVVPLEQAVRQTLQAMAGTEVNIRSVYRLPNSVMLGELCTGIELSSSFEGTMLLSCTAPTAVKLAERVLADADVELDPPLVADCLGEITNVVAGLAKALLARTPYGFVFSTPTLVTGMTERLKESPDGVIIVFSCDVGSLALQIYKRG